jgi:hypothetical protein
LRPPRPRLRTPSTTFHEHYARYDFGIGTIDGDRSTEIPSEEQAIQAASASDSVLKAHLDFYNKLISNLQDESVKQRLIGKVVELAEKNNLSIAQLEFRYFFDNDSRHFGGCASTYADISLFAFDSAGRLIVSGTMSPNPCTSAKDGGYDVVDTAGKARHVFPNGRSIPADRLMTLDDLNVNPRMVFDRIIDNLYAK